MIDKARESLERIKGHFDPKQIVQKDLFNSDFSNINQALDQARKNETILHVLRLYLKNKVRVQRFFQAYVLIINDSGAIISLNEDEYNALKEWLEDEDY